MSKDKDRITPLLLNETFTEEEIAYWKKKEPWNFMQDEAEEESKPSKKPKAD